MRTLDVGTGTGVLAIAAARSLRGAVLASDIDPMSVRLARQNARLNRAAGLTVILARGLGDRRFRDGAPYGLVSANILLGPLKGLAKPIGAMAAPGAFVVLSGLLPAQANAALAAYRAHGLVLVRRISLDGWATLVLRRPAQPISVRRTGEGDDRQHELKPLVAVQRVRRPPGKGQPASRKRALRVSGNTKREA
jgi:ribosomal protein L11 methyltransferase